MNPPPNPAAQQARADIMAYNAALHPDYRLTWRGNQRGVCVIGGQWRRNGAGEIEATYGRAELEFCNLVMEHTQHAA